MLSKHDKNNLTFALYSGPSRWDLSLALFDKETRFVTFMSSVMQPVTLEISIHAAERCNINDCEQWLLKGTVVSIEDGDETLTKKCVRREAVVTFNLRTRTGFISFPGIPS